MAYCSQSHKSNLLKRVAVGSEHSFLLHLQNLRGAVHDGFKCVVQFSGQLMELMVGMGVVPGISSECCDIAVFEARQPKCAFSAMCEGGEAQLSLAANGEELLRVVIFHLIHAHDEYPAYLMHQLSERGNHHICEFALWQAQHEPAVADTERGQVLLSLQFRLPEHFRAEHHARHPRLQDQLQMLGSHVTGPYKRNGISYREDEEVPLPRATTFDYQQSGYDRGHMCPSGDNKWDAQAQQDCFLLTNMCPQNHNLNGGDWNELEMKCRKWAEHYGDIYIVCGPILYRQKHKTIGRSRIVVPEAFYKVVLRLSPQPAAIGFIYKNEDGNRPMGDYINTVRQVERITGIDFFPQLPDELENRVEKQASLDDWR